MDDDAVEGRREGVAGASVGDVDALDDLGDPHGVEFRGGGAARGEHRNVAPAPGMPLHNPLFLIT